MDNNKIERSINEEEKAVVNEKIEQLESKLNSLNKKNKRQGNKAIKIIEVTIPYVVTAALSYKVFSSLNMTPFAKDNITKNAKVMKELDTEGNTSYYEQYEDFDKTATISRVGKWHMGKDGNFERQIKIYDAKKIDEFKEDITIEKLNRIGIDSLEYIFGEPIIERTERKNKLTLEEQNAAPYLKATVYYEDKDKNITTKESTSNNVVQTACFVIVALNLGRILEKILKALNDNSYSKRRNKISDVEEKINKLKEEMNNDEVIKQDSESADKKLTKHI